MLSFAACKKQSLLNEYKEAEENDLFVSNAVNPGGNAGYCVEDIETTTGYDSILTPTILGNKLNGYPYSVSVMQQAAQQILGTSAGVAVNAWYMRFKPTNADQLAALEDNDIDLFDYPLDYELVQEGDYYDDGTNSSPENIPWLYAVVPVSFAVPAGVNSQLLQQIHVPNDYRVEKKAFELTSNYVDDLGCTTSENLSGGDGENWVPQCPDVCNPSCGDYDPNLCTGGGGNPGPVTGPRIPAGSITVTDDIFNGPRPVRRSRVVAKRFLKVERTYTNDLGQYQFTKSFRNKVKLIVKFKNNHALIKGLRGVRIWQINFPVKINMGTYRGNLNNIQHNIPDNNSPLQRGSRHWAAATAHNNILEYGEYAAAESIGAVPNHLKVLLVNYGFVNASAPMYAKRFTNTLGTNFVNSMIIGFAATPFAGGINAFIGVVKGKIDMIASYNFEGTTKNSAHMAEMFYHELTHAAHYNKVGNNWYKEIVEGEFSESVLGFLTPGEKPYGAATGSYAGYIGLGESWAYHIGHFFTNLKYGAISPSFGEQGIGYANNIPVNGLSSNLNLLEDFSPNRTNDPFRWIPQGLYHDLSDDRNDRNAIPRRIDLDDNVNSYTNQQLFDAIDSDVTDIPSYRVRLLQENANRDAAGVTTIFGFYNY
jgi:hypothetical protein